MDTATRPAGSASHASHLERADRAFARAAGADPISGNAVRLLLDAAENYPAWLDAIAHAERTILFESYIVDDDRIGRQFTEALAARARAGVKVFVLCDWLGAPRAGALWSRLRDAGAEVRIFNPPRLRTPLQWLTRDHRKTIAIDGQVGFVSGLCVSAKWLGDPSRRLEPWRDTGLELRGPVIAELERAFTQVWSVCGDSALPDDAVTGVHRAGRAGDIRLRVIAGAPSATGTYRLDLVIAALAKRNLWLTDAYFVGNAPYVHALAAAARDGVDVRLLVPGASDLPAISALSRAIRRSRAGLKSPKRPSGSFLFLGPTGVGKTEVARALAEFLFGSEKSLIRFDMSEFMEKHSVSKLIGSPPGYVGYEEGGQLTERVKRNPYSVILLDEIEKAHPDVYNILLQVFEDGHLTDGLGNTIRSRRNAFRSA